MSRIVTFAATQLTISWDIEANLDKAEKAGQEGWLEAISLAVDQTVSDQGRTSLVLRQKPGTQTGGTVVERRRAYDRRLAELIESSQQSGDLRDDIHPILMARLIMGMVAWLISDDARGVTGQCLDVNGGAFML